MTRMQSPAAFAASLVIAGALAGCTSPSTGGPASSTPIQRGPDAPSHSVPPALPADSDDVLAVDPATAALNRAPSDVNVPPQYLKFVSGGTGPTGREGVIDESSVRFLGESDVASFWAAYDDEDNICLRAFFPDTLASGGSCTLISTYGTYGISVQTSDEENYAEGYLVPDAAVDSLDGLDVIPGSLSDNFVVVDPEMSTADRSAYLTRHEADIGLRLFVFATPQSEL
jgi:hypothetical protein